MENRDPCVLSGLFALIKLSNEKRLRGTVT